MKKQFFKGIPLLGLAFAFCGCTTTYPQEGKDSQPPAAHPGTDAVIPLAQTAYLSQGSLYLEVDSAGTISHHVAANKRRASGSLTGLSVPAGQRGIPPILPLGPLPTSDWKPDAGTPVPVFGVEMWNQLQEGIRLIVTPREPGVGAVVDLLNEQDLFHYYDEIGTLRTVPIAYKPDDIRVKETYSFEDVVKNSLPAVRQVLSGEGPPLDYALLNTGDDPASGFPFVFIDFREKQTVFLRTTGPAPRAASSLATSLRAATHLTGSHVRTVFEQPVTAVTRLVTLATRATTDLLDPRGLLPIQHGPIPPLADNPGMDLAAWEAKLDQVTGTRASPGNIQLLVDGGAFYPRLIDTVAAARTSVKLRTYIFDNDDYATQIAELLKRRADQIDVRVMVDGLGTIGAGAAAPGYQPTRGGTGSSVDFLRKDSKVKVKVLANPWFAGDHSKVAIVDDRTAFVGGMNIGREYRYEWHDLMMELHGPVVDELRTHFEKAWARQKVLGDFLAPLKTVKPVNTVAPGMYPVRVLTTAPQHTNILKAQVAAIREAKQRVYIENAYFTSDPILYELAMARRRGVDVRVILPMAGDSGLINRNNVIAANKMLANGIRVFIYPGMSHLKGAVYDGWACLGSANFDALSLEVNRELNLAFSHPPLVDELVERVFLADMEKSAELKEPFPEKWSDFLTELIADRL